MLFRRSMIAVLLILSMFLPLIHATPAQAQDNEPTIVYRQVTNEEAITLIRQNVELAPDQTCNPGCILITLWHKCASGLSWPTKQSTGFWQDDIYDINHNTHEYVGMWWDQDHAVTVGREYIFYDLTYPTGWYSVRFAATSGVFAFWWSSYIGPKFLGQGYSATYDFYLISHSGTYGC